MFSELVGPDAFDDGLRANDQRSATLAMRDQINRHATFPAAHVNVKQDRRQVFREVKSLQLESNASALPGDRRQISAVLCACALAIRSAFRRAAPPPSQPTTSSPVATSSESHAPRRASPGYVHLQIWLPARMEWICKRPSYSTAPGSSTSQREHGSLRATFMICHSSHSTRGRWRYRVL